MKTLIIYTDGSARPNPGDTGYGVHMVIGNDELKTKQIMGKYVFTNRGYTDKKAFKTVQSDDIKEIGIEKIIDIYGSTQNSNTNNTAELEGVINALRLVNNPLYSDFFEDIDEIMIKPDSSYVLGFLNKIKDGILDMDNVNVNQDYVRILKDELHKVMSKIGNIRFTLLEGHSGDLGNEQADLLSNMGRILGIRTGKDNEKVVVSDRSDYWDFKNIEKPDLLDSRLIFTYSKQPDPEYFRQLNYKEDNEIGKRGNEYMYSVVKMSEPDDYIYNIEKLVDKSVPDLEIPFVLRLKELYSKPIQRNIKLYGEDYLIRDDRGFIKIMTVDGYVVANEVHPPALTFKAEEIFNYLDLLLKAMEKGIELDKKEYEVVDITDEIYTTNDKGKTIIRKDRKNDKFELVFMTDYGNIILRPKLDFPSRNALKRLEDKNPRLYLVKRYRDNVLEYFTVFLSDKGKTATANAYANKLVKPKKKKK